MFTGLTGSGKTTFISDYSLDLCMQGVLAFITYIILLIIHQLVLAFYNLLTINFLFLKWKLVSKLKTEFITKIYFYLKMLIMHPITVKICDVLCTLLFLFVDIKTQSVIAHNFVLIAGEYAVGKF